ncbi:MAG: hypothetical protein KDA52_24765, partial [Planctomycetaceae bacterium]|nr:hypothetical protein [Planctomycetaceae bacterium]
ALTDVLLCLWMLWGVYWAWRAILTGRLLAIFLAGLFASLAWWTKYNGWLTLAISGSGTLAWLIVPRITPVRLAAHFKLAAQRDDAPSRGPVLLRWSLLAAIAIIGWLPILIDLQKYGGYAAVSANHAGYFVGLGGWWESFARQCAHLSYLGWFWSAFGLFWCEQIRRKYEEPRGRIPTTKGSEDSQDISARSGQCLAGWIMAAWFLGLLVATPLYTPYLRVALPFISACWLAAGWLFQWNTSNRNLNIDQEEMTTTDGQTSRFSARWTWVFSTGVLALGIASIVLMQKLPRIWGHRTSLKAIAGQMDKELKSSSGPTVIAVLGEPGLFFHLALVQTQRHEDQRMVILPAADFSSVATAPPTDTNVFMVTGPHSPLLSDQTQDVEERLSLMSTWSYRPSDLVWLDQQATSFGNPEREEP